MNKCQHSAHPGLLLIIIIIPLKQKLGGKPIVCDFAGSTSVRFIDNWIIINVHMYYAEYKSWVLNSIS